MADSSVEHRLFFGRSRGLTQLLVAHLNVAHAACVSLSVTSRLYCAGDERHVHVRGAGV